ncbi:hypothetical protein [Leifsonia shinshuensis]|uniref:hypothetical protein n=1 Tax=Leifsonia shinshuensis TaxID=150026 RepID=UPI002858E5C5|nr:hypothetical protein [Leifsonia shinshuensis]MDR6972714.1 hypothetical protein [Leifsonia shinshuensis]
MRHFLGKAAAATIFAFALVGGAIYPAAAAAPDTIGDASEANQMRYVSMTVTNNTGQRIKPHATGLLKGSRFVNGFPTHLDPGQSVLLAAESGSDYPGFWIQWMGENGSLIQLQADTDRRENVASWNSTFGGDGIIMQVSDVRAPRDKTAPDFRMSVTGCVGGNCATQGRNAYYLGGPI